MMPASAPALLKPISVARKLNGVPPSAFCAPTRSNSTPTAVATPAQLLIGSTTWYQPLPSGVEYVGSVSVTTPQVPPASSFTSIASPGRSDDFILKTNDS